MNSTRNSILKLCAIVVLLAIFLFLKISKSDKDGQDIKSAHFRIVSYNIENLYDTQKNPEANDDLTPDGSLRWTEKRYSKKLEDISTAIHLVGGGIAPAVVALCEVENATVVENLLNRTKLGENNYRYIITASKDYRGSNVALLYQSHLLNIIESTSHRVNIGDDEPRYSRDVLHVTASTAGNDTLDFFVCHFPSRSGGVNKTRPYRILSAKMLREKTDSVFGIRKQANIIIMGDFNDYPEDDSMREVLGAKSAYDKETDNSLHNLFLHKSDDTKMGSYKYQGKWKYIDQFVVSSNLLNSTEGAYIKNSEAHAFYTDYLLEADEKYGGKKPYRTYSGFKYLGGVSDHLPIYMDLEIEEAANR